jgi:anti-anti-sigma regulatory factor
MTLRIQRSDEDELVVFALAGRIRVEQVPELLTLVRSESAAHRIILDLDQVKLVDRDAVLFLALCETLGATLRNCSAYIRKWIDQERNAGQNGSEGPTKSAR